MEEGQSDVTSAARESRINRVECLPIGCGPLDVVLNLHSYSGRLELGRRAATQSKSAERAIRGNADGKINQIESFNQENSSGARLRTNEVVIGSSARHDSSD